MNRFTMANDSDIMNGSVTDVYFEKTMEYLTMLKKNPYVTMDVTTQSSAYEYINFSCMASIYFPLCHHNGRLV